MTAFSAQNDPGTSRVAEEATRARRYRVRTWLLAVLIVAAFALSASCVNPLADSLGSHLPTPTAQR